MEYDLTDKEVQRKLAKKLGETQEVVDFAIKPNDEEELDEFKKAKELGTTEEVVNYILKEGEENISPKKLGTTKEMKKFIDGMKKPPIIGEGDNSPGDM